MTVLLRAAFAAFAIVWLGAGANSDNTPLLGPAWWFALCGAAAGTALIVAVWPTVSALRTYVGVGTLVGLLRGLAYATDDALAPLAVWLLFAGHTGLMYHELRFDRRRFNE